MNQPEPEQVRQVEVSYSWSADRPFADPHRAAVDRVFQEQGWAVLNDRTHRILYATDQNGQLIGFHVMQLFPHTEPLWVHEEYRGGNLATELATRMFDFMQSVGARGFIAIADSPHAAALCEKFGMKRVESPVYIL